MSEEADLPGVHLLCGVSDGKKKMHGQALDHVRVRDGSEILGGLGDGTHEPSGFRFLLVHCPKHGMLVVSHERIITASREAARRGRLTTEVQVTRRAPPIFRQRRRRRESPSGRLATPERDA